ncbi:DUF6928 family protein [Corynebacterium endometrii]|uniref:Uncharacterized protein n=1 Tax=Corynebacterium endometrii TaxID=2488819 RepID=A0A4P7QEP3_9CORY|nr:hypothetical protein [Corynebacterium endometrii]QCB27953.1 hypothetical protein CENDO_03295 [Corynebacterium endometrii]
MNVSRAVVTLWYINAADPAAVLKAEPKADRGFGRKYLAQLNPAFPVTPIGQFPLNRSAQADVGEFYIGGYPGVTVVQTVIMDDGLCLSKLSPLLLFAVPARDVFVFASNENEDYAGFAHWHRSTLKRSFCGTRYEIFEDEGLPEPFEGPYWAGEKSTTEGGIALPFQPQDLMESAQRHWLGVEVGEDGPDLQVVGYAVDGRPEPKVDEPKPSPKTVTEVASASASKLGLGSAHSDYDDYESHVDAPEPATGDEFARLKAASTDAARRVGREGKVLLKKLGRGLTHASESLAERLHNRNK